MSFRDDFAKTPPGPQRERLAYEAAITQGKPVDFDPVTVNGPNGTKITFYVTHDFLKVDGQYLTVSGTTAQMIAQHFGMYLPSNTIVDQVRKTALNSGTAVTVNPLSGTGYRGTNGQWYSPQDVVNSRINSTDAAVEFSNRVNQALSGQDSKKGPVHIESGGKYITMPPASGSLGLHGIWQGGTPIQGGYGTIHKDYEDHTEYGSYVRLVMPQVYVVYPNDDRKKMSMEEFAKSDLRSALFVDGQDIRNGQLATYDVKRDKANLTQISGGTSGSQPENAPESEQKLKEINQFLDSIMTETASLRNKRSYLEPGEEPTLDLESVISPQDYGYQPGAPPPGYGGAGFTGRAPKDVEDVAKRVLKTFLANKKPIGSMIPFSVDGVNYMARAEVHSNSPYGISVYKSTSNTPGNGAQGRMKLLQRVYNSPEEKLEGIEQFLSEIEKDL